MQLVKISDRKYVGASKDRSVRFTLSYQDRGVYGRGKTWNLSAIYGNDNPLKEFVAEFCVKDDWNGVYKECEQSKIWTNMAEIQRAAETIAENILRAYGLE